MSGLPFGAARQHPVSADALCYEGIAGIEFIEADPSLPYPRSAAYRPCALGAQMRVRDGAPEVAELELDHVQARSLIAALVEAGVFSWARVYRPAQGTFALAATEWRLEVTFAARDGGKPPRAFRVEGENVFPDGYERAVGILLGAAQYGAAAEQGEGGR